MRNSWRVRKLSLVVSPTSGGGKGVRKLPLLLNTLEARGHDTEASVTNSLDHAGQLAAEAHARGRVAVAVGGDGLVGAVARTGVKTGGSVGIIPCGRGNDLARTLRITSTNAVSVLGDGRDRKIDVGTSGERLFTCVASLGFDSLVVDESKRFGFAKNFAYSLAVLSALPKWTNADFEIDVDGELVRMRAMLVAVANGAHFGGGMKIAPDSKLDDGLFDVIVIGDISKVEFLKQVPKVFVGRHMGHSQVSHWRARKVSVSTSAAVSRVYDGEAVENGVLDVECHKRALSIVTPT